MPERLAALREHIVDDAAQLALLSRLEQLVADMLANSQRIVDTRRRQGAVAAGSLIGTRPDATRMSEIRRVVSQMSQSETEHVKATLAASLEDSTRRFAYLAALLGAIAAIVAVASVLIARTWRRCTDAEAALRVALARLRATFDGTMEGLLTVTRSGTIESINAAARRVLKLPGDREMLRRLSPDGRLPDASRSDALLACVHRLGGSAGTFGAPRVSAAAERLEELLRRGESVEADEALANLAAALDRELNRGPLQR